MQRFCLEKCYNYDIYNQMLNIHTYVPGQLDLVLIALIMSNHVVMIFKKNIFPSHFFTYRNHI